MLICNNSMSPQLHHTPFSDKIWNFIDSRLKSRGHFVLLFDFGSWLRWVSYAVEINSLCLHLSFLVMLFGYSSPFRAFSQITKSVWSVHWANQLTTFRLLVSFSPNKRQSNWRFSQSQKLLLLSSLSFKTWALLMTTGIRACHKYKALIWQLRKKDSKIRKITQDRSSDEWPSWKTEMDVRDIFK